MKTCSKLQSALMWIIASISGLTFYTSYLTPTTFNTPSRRKLEMTSEDPYVILASELPNEAYNPTMANGYLGHAIYSDTIYMNGLYNGEKGNSHRARIPGTLPYLDMERTIFVSKDESRMKTMYTAVYKLDMKNGTYMQRFEIEDAKSEKTLCTVSQTFYAHKVLSRVLVTQISVKFRVEGTLQLALKSSSGEPSTDIRPDHVKEVRSHRKSFKAVTSLCYHTMIPEQVGMKLLPVCVVSSIFPETLSFVGKPGDVRGSTYLTSISDNKEETEKFFKLASEFERKGILLSKHQEEWVETWKNGSLLIKTENMFYSSSFISALYYMLSAFPSSSINTYPYHFFGASPGGLTNGGKGQDYLGHVFWDQDFWMLPALLPLFPNSVKHGLEYRIARLNSAKEKAKKLGFKGAMFPWESAYSGMDVCPGESYVLYEQHVTGDLIHVLKQYIYATGDWSFLTEKIPSFPPTNNATFFSAWDMIYNTAKFWYSHVLRDNKKNLYVINDVMGPDEYYAPVNNSAFTNVVARQNLEFAIRAAHELNIPLPEKESFQKVVDDIFVPYDKDLNYHPEFEGYNPNDDIVKQADTIMLGFPLMSAMSESSRESDLKIYSNMTDPLGPAMTWSMFAINWNDLGHDKEADQYFLRQHNNIQPPFQIWSEEPNGGGAVNFLTGIGGYLQSVFYGYLNLRIYKAFMDIQPRLLPPLEDKVVSEFKVSGLKYQGVIIDISVKEDSYSVSLAGWIGKKHLSILLHTLSSDHVLSNVGDNATFSLKSKCTISIRVPN